LKEYFLPELHAITLRSGLCWQVLKTWVRRCLTHV